MDLKSAIVLFLAIEAAMAVNYCKNMKCEKKPHVACNSPAANGGWGPACSDDRELVNITPELQNRILEIQNKVRNQQAMGKTPNYGPAVRMSTLVWDDELAKMAEFNARLCKYGHDPCRNTEKYYAAGQNIAKGGGMTDDKEIIERLVPAWFELEAQNGYIEGWMDMIKKFQSSPDPNVEIGHFTQVVWEDAVAIGCGGSKYTDEEGQQAILVCNYGFGNMQGAYVYQSGPTASKCKTGTNPDYPALCSVDEDYSEDIGARSGWNLKPDIKPDGSLSYVIPPGCDDDTECRKMKKDPSKYFSKFMKPKDTKPKVNIMPDGQVSFDFPAGCDQACQNKAVQDFMATHPEYGK